MFIRIVKMRFQEDKIEAFLNNFEDPSFFIFTDDINWATNNILKYLIYYFHYFLLKYFWVKYFLYFFFHLF